ncbi:hypothetical protein BASA61_007429 [Batrachochytrium salamandrivorans]|nr:hypothetical protein BASA61_007429 [Batrachochytrium salamandrivorans]
MLYRKRQWPLQRHCMTWSSPTIGSVPTDPWRALYAADQTALFCRVAETDSFLHEICKTMYGTIFGEIGILFDIKRTATVVAKTYCTLVTLLSDVVHKKLAFYPEIERVMKSAAQDRLALMSQELQRAGRQPPPELREKF